MDEPITLPDLDEIDDILDEIEENEKDEEERRKSETQIKVKVTVPINDESVDKVVKTAYNQKDLIIWVRDLWKIGSKCEVYSHSSKRWFIATINHISNDSENEWLEIQYMAGNIKQSLQIRRDDVNTIRPLTKAMLMYGYIHNAIHPDGYQQNNYNLSLYRKLSASSSSALFGELQSPIDNMISPRSVATNPYYNTSSAVMETTDIDSTKLLLYLTKNVDEFKENKESEECPLLISRFTNGYVNPPYLLKYGPKKYVMRKAVKSTSATNESPTDMILKQYQIMTVLKQYTTIPVPTPLHFCDDSSVIGDAFYLIEFVEGRVFNNESPELPTLTKQDREEIYDEMIQIMARMHCVDYNKLGLNHIKNEEWSKKGYLNKFDNSKVADHEINKTFQRKKTISTFENDIKQYQYLINYPKALVHGDFHLGNIIWHPVENRIIAVVDWEFGCIGDPLIDLSYFTSIWIYRHKKQMILNKEDIPKFFEGFGDSQESLNKIGIPSEIDVLGKYANYLMVNNVKHFEIYLKNINNDWNFYCALCQYRLLQIFHHLYAESADSPLTEVFPIDLLDFFSILGQDVLKRDKMKISF